MPRLAIAALNMAPTYLSLGNNPELGESYREWIQPVDLWALIFYRHSGVLYHNAVSRPYRYGDVSIWAPGVRGGHQFIGESTPHFAARFNLPGTGVRASLPALIHAPDLEPELDASSAAASYTLSRGIAAIWHFLWRVSRPVAEHRVADELYEAEDWIRRNLERPFAVTELVKDLGIPQRTLLRLFQQQHGTTIKGFVNQTRAREACRLLSSTGIPIKQIASRVGCPDPHAFNKLIRSSVGVSPSKLRELTT